MNAQVKVNVSEVREPVCFADLARQADRCAKLMVTLRKQVHAPNREKQAPMVASPMVAQMCGITLAQLNNRVAKGDLPAGESAGQGSKRNFTVEQTQAWVQAYNVSRPRPAGAPGCVVAMANFKGGSTKTTTTMTLAQGLSLRGYRVLCIDLDPQGSLSTLFGLLSELDVRDDMTVIPLMSDEETGLGYAVRETYWPNIDLVSASSTLFGLEFLLPTKQVRDRHFRFWDQLNRGMEDVRATYDVILIDTPPSLSYLTINGLMAADGLLMPLPPSALDFASSSQFWRLFSEMGETFKALGVDKQYAFAHILLSRVDNNESVTPVLRRWIQTAYQEKVLASEVPRTAVTSTAAAEFGTVYDIGRYTGSAKTYQRAREAYDACVVELERSINLFWEASQPNTVSASAVASAVANFPAEAHAA